MKLLSSDANKFLRIVQTIDSDRTNGAEILRARAWRDFVSAIEAVVKEIADAKGIGTGDQEQIAQDVAINLAADKGFAALSGADTPYAYMRGVVRRAIANHFRSGRLESVIVNAPEFLEREDATDANGGTSNEIIELVNHTLDEPTRSMFWQKYEGYTSVEIAARFGVTYEAACSRIQRAFISVRCVLETAGYNRRVTRRRRK